jgi:hypothetical protein
VDALLNAGDEIELPSAALHLPGPQRYEQHEEESDQA